MILLSSSAVVVDLTSAEVLLIRSESRGAADRLARVRQPVSAREHPRGLGLARGDGRVGRDRFCLMEDDSTLGEAEVATEVVGALHPSFAGVV